MHEYTIRRLLQARQWRMTPPTYDYVEEQPCGLVKEIMECWQADITREVHFMNASRPKKKGEDD